MQGEFLHNMLQNQKAIVNSMAVNEDGIMASGADNGSLWGVPHLVCRTRPLLAPNVCTDSNQCGPSLAVDLIPVLATDSCHVQLYSCLPNVLTKASPSAQKMLPCVGNDCPPLCISFLLLPALYALPGL